MYKIFRLPVLIFILVLIVISSLSADTRTENIELYLVIDKSKSMVEEISDVTDYINENFIKRFLVPGDRLVLIQFYGMADLIFDGIITASNKNDLISDISSIPANGRFTDIGNALDRLDIAVNSAESRTERKYFILLTDGKQEAPPESPYYTPDGSFNHRFLENTKVILKEGWKIMILGIGQDTIVEELADELGTTHEVLDFDDVPPEIIQQDEIIGRILASGFKIENGTIIINLKSEGYTTERKVVVDQITYQLPGANYNLLTSSYSFMIQPDSESIQEITIPEDSLKQLSGNDTVGSIIFNFAGDTPFLPAVFDSVLLSSDSHGENIAEKSSEKSENDMNNGINWLIIVIIILVVASVIAVLIIRNLVFHREDDNGSKNKKDEISIDS